MQTRFHFTASRRPEAQQALGELSRIYGQTDADEADIIVALGGDGAMLDALRARFRDRGRGGGRQHGCRQHPGRQAA